MQRIIFLWILIFNTAAQYTGISLPKNFTGSEALREAQHNAEGRTKVNKSNGKWRYNTAYVLLIRDTQSVHATL
jgi:hypothetical protein